MTNSAPDDRVPVSAGGQRRRQRAAEKQRNEAIDHSLLLLRGKRNGYRRDLPAVESAHRIAHQSSATRDPADLGDLAQVLQTLLPERFHPVPLAQAPDRLGTCDQLARLRNARQPRKPMIPRGAHSFLRKGNVTGRPRPKSGLGARPRARSVLFGDGGLMCPHNNFGTNRDAALCSLRKALSCPSGCGTVRRSASRSSTVQEVKRRSVFCEATASRV